MIGRGNMSVLWLAWQHVCVRVGRGNMSVMVGRGNMSVLWSVGETCQCYGW